MLFRIKPLSRPLSPAESSESARRLLLDLLADSYGFTRLPAIATGAEGKPYFPDHPEIHFSLSHCRSAIMAAIDSREIGCDIEDVCHDISSALLDVAFSPAERGAILRSSDPAMELTRLWTRKEAVVKRAGIIPDDPAAWPSADPGLTTVADPARPFAFSIAVTI